MRRALLFCLLGLFVLGPEARAQATGTISGTVTGDAGQPLAGASVSVAGRGALTGADGTYTITGVPAGQHPVRAAMIGYGERTQTVTVAAGRTATADFQLTAEAVELEGIVAVGYGTQRKESVTGSVATVQSEELALTPSVTTAGTLVGKVPGVIARQSEGRPGAGARIQIRNLGAPLYVIDGIPTDEGQFNNVDANDIQSISILKDASAAAVYGNRAANGVVLVTTKRGRRNSDNRVDLKAYYGWQNLERFARPSDAATWVRALIESDVNLNGRTSWTREELAKWEAGTEQGYRGFDWYDFAIQENAPQTYLSASSTGGSENINYYVSLARLDQEAMFPGYVFNRTNLQANIDGQISERLKVGAQINGRVENRRNPGNPGFDDYWQPLFGIYRNLPTERPYANDNPKYIANTTNIESNHALLNYDLTGFWQDTWRVQQTNLTAEYQTPLDGLMATARYGYYLADNVQNTFEYTYDVYTYDAATDTYLDTGGNDNPYRDRWSRKVEENTLQLMLNYDQQFGDHGLGMDLAFEANERVEPGYWIRSQPTTNAIDLINFNELKALNDYENESARMGYVLRTNYNFADRYLLEFAGRYDGSWRFAPDKRWGLFPSVSAGWRISNEPFYRNSGIGNVVNDLKLRASRGTLGDERNVIGPFAYLEGYNFRRGSAVLDGRLVTGIDPIDQPQRSLSWLKSTMTNVGLDFGLMESRLSGTLEYFYRERTGLPELRYDVLIPTEVAISPQRENLNADAHTGFEVGLTYADSHGGDLQYSVGGNLTFARERDLYTYKPRFGNSWDQYRSSIEDRWAYINWGYQVVGQFQSQEQIDNHPVDIDGQNNTTLLPGDFIYMDVNGDGVISGLDERPIGFRQGALPYMNFGINTFTAYKGFDLALNFAGAAFQSYERAWEMRIPFQNEANSPAYMFEDRWHREDPFDPNSRWVPGTYPAVRKGRAGHSNFRKSDFWVTNVNYLRLNTLELGYTLPRRLLDRLDVRQARIYLNGYNVFSLDNLKQYGLDPEVEWGNGLQYPRQRVFNLGVNLGL